MLPSSSSFHSPHVDAYFSCPSICFSLSLSLSLSFSPSLSDTAVIDFRHALPPVPGPLPASITGSIGSTSAIRKFRPSTSVTRLPPLFSCFFLLSFLSPFFSLCSRSASALPSACSLSYAARYLYLRSLRGSIAGSMILHIEYTDLIYQY
jgi:hypothetical protein